MGNTITVTVRDKIATTERNAQYVCGNSDYIITFDFDAEWDMYETKTARFVHGDAYTDIVFSGTECSVPIMSNVSYFKVGVFAGDLHTTTDAHVAAMRSILCDAGVPADPPESVYNQIMALLSNIKIPKLPDTPGVLLYVGDDGCVAPLKLGAGLEIENGTLIITTSIAGVGIAGVAIAGR